MTSEPNWEDWMNPQWCDKAREDWTCTRGKGHDGPHVAHGIGGAAIFAWWYGDFGRVEFADPEFPDEFPKDVRTAEFAADSGPVNPERRPMSSEPLPLDSDDALDLCRTCGECEGCIVAMIDGSCGCDTPCECFDDDEEDV